MNVSERFKIEIIRYRVRGGRMWRLALDHGMSPSMLSATLSGARRVDYDERIIQIGEALGLKPAECFEDEGSAVAS